jgi:hypothetical protein
MIRLSTLTAFIILPSFVVADEFRSYTISMDREKPGVVHNPFGAVDDDFASGRWWGSVGWTRGANFPNRASAPITGMWIKAKYSGTGQDSFSKASTGGAAFPKCWRKKDGTEMIFKGPGIPLRGYFWMHVPKTDDTDDRNRFFSQLYSTDGKPDVPTDGNWEEISVKGTDQPEIFADRAKSIPNELDEAASIFAQSVNDGRNHSKEVKALVGPGPDFTGKPYFYEASDMNGKGQLTFWLLDARTTSYRAYSIDTSSSSGQTQMQVVLQAFQQKAQQIAVFTKPTDQSRPVTIIVYP